MPTRTVTIEASPSQFPAAPTILAEGSTADGKYRIERFVGMIDARAVYQVRALQGKERLALHALARSEGWQAFGAEVVAAALVWSENIVGLVDKGLLGGEEPYVVTSWTGEDTLEGLLRARDRIAPRLLAPIARDILSGVADLHDAGLTHGDLSPSRISLSATAGGVRAMLTDRGRFALGLAGGPESETPGAGESAYQAPELGRGGVATPLSDVYSIGAVLFRAVTAWRPGARNSAPPPGEAPLDPAFARILTRALARDPGERWPSAAAMRDAVDEWQATVTRVDSLLAAFLERDSAGHLGSCDPLAADRDDKSSVLSSSFFGPGER